MTDKFTSINLQPLPLPLCACSEIGQRRGLARKACVSSRHIWHIVTNSRRGSPSVLQTIREVLGEQGSRLPPAKRTRCSMKGRRCQPLAWRASREDRKASVGLRPQFIALIVEVLSNEHSDSPTDDEDLTPEDQARVDAAYARVWKRSKKAGEAQRALGQRRQPKGALREPRRRGGKE